MIGSYGNVSVLSGAHIWHRVRRHAFVQDQSRSKYLQPDKLYTAQAVQTYMRSHVRLLEAAQLGVASIRQCLLVSARKCSMWKPDEQSKLLRPGNFAYMLHEII
eukprot:jgi/Ulvmu1/4975/UM207_0019.1